MAPSKTRAHVSKWCASHLYIGKVRDMEVFKHSY